MRRPKAPASIPNSENLVSTQTPDARRGHRLRFSLQLGHFASARILLGSPPGSARPRAGLRMGRRSRRGPPTSKGRRRSESFSFQHSARPCLLGLRAVDGPLWPLRKLAGPGWGVRVWVFRASNCFSHISSRPSLPFPRPTRRLAKTRVREKQLPV